MGHKEHKGYCVKCEKSIIIKNPSSIKIRNKNSNTGNIESMKGKCPECETSVYCIIGKG